MAETTVAAAEPVWVVLADGRRGRDRSDAPTRRALVHFGVGTALTLLLLLFGGFVLGDRAAEREGVADVRRLTELLGRALIEPNLDGGLLHGDADAFAAFDAVVRDRFIGPTGAVRVKLWTAGGRIVYSDERRLIGDRYALGPEEIDALRSRRSNAEVSDLGRPENRFERASGPRLLEVYTPVRAPDGPSLLFEAYFRYDVVTARRAVILRSFASITLVALLVFAAFQLSLGFLSVRWLHRKGERLRLQAVEASDLERRRIASDLHDGIVQDLLGASYVIAGAAGAVRACGREDVARAMRGTEKGIRESVRGLRSMMVEIYPMSLRTAGLRAALSDLLAPLPARGIATDLVLPEELDLPAPVEAALYRTAREAVRNVVHHARATRVELRVVVQQRWVVLTVSDDGIGFVPGGPAEPGHIGLHVLADLAEETHALLEVTSAPGRGTVLRLEMPS